MKNNLEVGIYSPKDLKQVWYVYIYDTNQQKIINKFSKGINKFYTIEERQFHAEALKRAVELKLKAGWSPEVKKSKLPSPKTQQYLIEDALEFSLERLALKLEPKTIQDYSGTKRFFLQALKRLDWSGCDISEYEQYHIREAMLNAKQHRKWKNKNYNKHITYLKAIFTQLKKDYVISVNPVHGISSEKEEHTTPYETLTPKEQTIVFKYFTEVRPNFLTHYKTIYYCGIRPKELLFIKCKMVDIKNALFVLDEEITKNDKPRRVPIPNDLLKDLKKFDLSNPEWYLFGENYKPGFQKRGMNSSSNYWKTHVIGWLGINKKQYAGKHKGADDKLRNGVPLQAVQKVFGHSKPTTTEIYGRIMEDIMFDEVRKKTPILK